MPLVGVQAAQQRLHFDLVADVERCGRLVEQQQLRALRQRAGNHDALPFAAAERAERASFERRGAGRVERAPGDGEILRPFERERAEVRKAAHQDDVEDGEVEGRVGFLRHDGDSPRDVAARPLGHRPAVERHRAGLRTQRAAEDLQQRGLAGAVGAENADQIAAVDGERHAIQDVRLGDAWDASRRLDTKTRRRRARSMARLLPASVAPKKDAPEWPGFLTCGSRQRVDVFPGCHPVTGQRTE